MNNYPRKIHGYKSAKEMAAQTIRIDKCCKAIRLALWSG